MTDLSQQTLSFLAITNHHVVPVLEKYNLDFCCKGKRTLADACKEKGIDLENITHELESVMIPDGIAAMPLATMTAEKLIDDILLHEHELLKYEMPIIYSHLERVVYKHGDRFPYMKQVFELFASVQKDMNEHMKKEENDSFPLIKELEKKDRKNIPATFLQELQNEHEVVGDLMARIHDLTNRYTQPEEACTTFRLSLTELNEFENNLHRHVHTENNILLPKVEDMIAEQKTSFLLSGE